LIVAAHAPKTNPDAVLVKAIVRGHQWFEMLKNRKALSIADIANCESFNGKLRDELLNGEIFYSLKEAKAVIGQWRSHYNAVRPHSSLGYPEASEQPVNEVKVQQPQTMGLRDSAMGNTRSHFPKRCELWD
jgi:hypothetical protein